MKTRSLVLALLVCSMAGGHALGQESNKPKLPEGAKDGMKKIQEGMKKDEPKKDAAPAGMPGMNEEMKAWMEAGQPGDAHKWMAKLCGEWDATSKMFDPNMPPSESKGTMKMSMIMGGRYTHSFYKGEFMGQPFEGSGLMGYDNVSKKFQSVWGDSMSTMLMWSTGDYDKSTGTLTMLSECMDPVTKKMCKGREVSQFKDDGNTWTMAFYQTKEGKEQKVMEITYVRKGTAKTEAAKPAEKSMMDKAKEEAEKKVKDEMEKAKKALPGNR